MEETTTSGAPQKKESKNEEVKKISEGGPKKISVGEMAQNERDLLGSKKKIKQQTPLDKVLENLKKAKEKAEEKKVPLAKKENVVLYLPGNFSPIHQGHLNILKMARQYLQQTCKKRVLGAFVSPTQDVNLKKKYQMRQNEVYDLGISAYHRVKMCNLVLHNSSWIDVDTFDASSGNFVAMSACANRLAEYIRGAHSLLSTAKIVIVCGSEIILQAPTMGYNPKMVEVCCVASKHNEEIDIKRDTFAKYGLKMHVIVNEELEKQPTSTAIRCELKKGTASEDHLSPSVIAYMKKHALAAIV